ncbi:MAG: phosphatase PAP2 family protein [Aurantimonas endophytica]|uniref:phosphatase PAP2 family protein n=1 Tax=Aurantimonas endophytica TaxID=1522175 RepID=UPI0030028885
MTINLAFSNRPGTKIFSSIRSRNRAVIRAEGLLIATIGLQIAIVIALRLAYANMSAFDPFSLVAAAMGFAAIVGPSCIFIVVAICFHRVVRSRPEGSASVALIREIWGCKSLRARLSNGLPVIAIFVPFITLFGYLKTNIPLIQPFAWDGTFTEWDRAIFLGSLPYEFLQPVMGIPFVVFLTNVAYNVWFFLMWGFLTAFAFSTARSELRTRYLLSYFLTWIVIGNCLALAFSSAGPCFNSAIGLLPDPYQPLMDSLRKADAVYPIFALTTQDMLWDGYIGERSPLGISAMPSLHNATATLMALAAWRFGRAIGLTFVVYAIWIFVGSISLGWHYAVDGLVALPVTLALWALSGFLARWWHQSDRAAAKLKSAGAHQQSALSFQ